MLQYKIPQNVGIEDRIVGPFSLRQLIIVAVGGGISYVLFAISSKLYELNILEYIVLALPGLVALAAALIKINNITFTKFVLLALEFTIKPNKRLWDHRGILAIVAPDLSEKNKEKKIESEVKNKKNVNLRDLSKILDSGGFDHIKKIAHKDIDNVEDKDLMSQAFFGHKKNQSNADNMYWRTKDSQKERLKILAKKPTTIITKKKPEVPITKATNTKEPSKKDVSIPEEKVITPTKDIVIQRKERKIVRKKAKLNDNVLPSTTKSKTTTASKNSTFATKINAQKLTKTAKTSMSTEDAKKKKSLTNKKTSIKLSEKVSEIPKKKIRRKRKTKVAKPVRQETQIINVVKNQPVKLYPKPKIEKAPTQNEFNSYKNSKLKEQPEKKNTSGEFHLADLQKGEIEINLD